jgi:shikimate kinase
MTAAGTGVPGFAPARPVVFVGLMGSGKSSVGRRVAGLLDLPFVDVDAEIEARTGVTIAELFARDGEPAFRVLEADLVAELLDRGGRAVIAPGGGAVLDARTRQRLRDRADVIWLRALPSTLTHRTKPDDTRPLLTGDHRATLERLAAERDPLYGEVADHIVDVDLVERRAVVDAVLSALGVPVVHEMER